MIASSEFESQKDWALGHTGVSEGSGAFRVPANQLDFSPAFEGFGAKICRGSLSRKFSESQVEMEDTAAAAEVAVGMDAAQALSGTSSSSVS